MRQFQHIHTELYSTPQKKPKPDWRSKTGITNTTPPTVGPNITDTLKIRNIELLERIHFLQEQLRISHLQQSIKNQSVRSCRCSQTYQSQIRNLQYYLLRHQDKQIDKKHILKIFGLLEPGSYLNQQQAVLKQLSIKVKLLIDQNSRLRQEVQSKLYHHQDDKYQRQNQRLKIQIQQYQRQNQRYRGLLNQSRKDLDKPTRQIERLRKQIQQYRKQNQKYKLVIEQYKNIDNQKQIKLYEQNRLLKNKITKYQRQSQHLHQNIRQLNNQIQKTMHTRQLKNSVLIKSTQQLKSQMNHQLRQFYNTIDIKNKNLNNQLNNLQIRLKNSQKLIEHLKFQRNIKIQNTIRKSKRYSDRLPQVIGDGNQNLDAQDNSKMIQSHTHHIQYNPSRISQISSQNSLVIQQGLQRIKILQQANNNLGRENHQLKSQLNAKHSIINQYINKLVILQNQLYKSKVPEQKVKLSKDYSQQIQKIRQILLSCNINNFDTFQIQFQQIINQRNSMSDKLLIIKQSIQDKQKLFKIQKLLAEQQRKSKQYLEKIQFLNFENMKLKQRVYQVQKQIDQIKNIQINKQVRIIESITKQPHGFNGLQWQKIVRQCIEQTGIRLQDLQQQLKRDIRK